MIVEAFKIITSVFPFIKEAFLWRDGAQAGKPITQKNLVRRKVAVFVLLGSLVLNYFSISKLHEIHNDELVLVKAIEDAKAREEELQKKIDALQANSMSCVKFEDVMDLCDSQMQALIDGGVLKKTKKPATPKK